MLSKSISAGQILNLQFICMNDLELQRLTKIQYLPNEWNNDIDAGLDIFNENISNNTNSTFNGLRQNSIEQGRSYFPARFLSESEHSVAMRHVHALNIIANGQSPCIVLEDDAQITNQTLFHSLIENFKEDFLERAFYDLCDDFIPIVYSSGRYCKKRDCNYWIKPIAVTRTLMAYALSPITAKRLLSAFSHYSLPIDMQFQVLLSKLNIPGLSLINTPFSHGSKSGDFASAIKP